MLKHICKGNLKVDEKVLEELSHKKTKNGVTLAHCCKSGNAHPDSSIGFYAGDLECYDLFAPVTGAIIQFYHGTQDHTRDWTVPDLQIPADFPHDRIRTSRIRVARNLGDYPFPSSMTKEQRLEVEKKVSEVLLKAFGGEYHKITEFEDKALKEKLKCPIFHKDDHYLEASGTFDDWPHGRGIYVSDDRAIVVWVNEEDHMRIQSFQKGFALKEAFKRLADVLNELDKHLKIAVHPRHGYINACPTNCGTGMRMSVHAKFQKIATDVARLKELSSKYGMAVRPEGGEAAEFGNAEWVDISNKIRLGLSESKIAENVHNGIVALMKIDSE